MEMTYAPSESGGSWPITLNVSSTSLTSALVSMAGGSSGRRPVSSASRNLSRSSSFQDLRAARAAV